MTEAELVEEIRTYTKPWPPRAWRWAQIRIPKADDVKYSQLHLIAWLKYRKNEYLAFLRSIDVTPNFYEESL